MTGNRLNRFELNIESIPDTDEGNVALYHELARIEKSGDLMKEEANRRTQILILLSQRGLSVEPMTKSEDEVKKPMGEYSSFEDCLEHNRDKDDPKAYCGEIMHRVEGKD